MRTVPLNRIIAGGAGCVVLLVLAVAIATSRDTAGRDKTRALGASSSQLPQSFKGSLVPPGGLASDLQLDADRARALALISFPASLEGTDVDGALELDARGHFIANKNALRLFEYFFTALGEEPTEVILARIGLQIDALPPEAAAEAYAFLQQFLDYRAGASEMMLTGGEAADFKEAFERVSKLRSEAFGEELAHELFADEERYAQSAFERWEVVRDPDLSEAEKWDRVMEIEAELNPQQRSRIIDSLAPAETARIASLMREEGASDQDVWQLRADALGEEAAWRLADLDEKHKVWNERVAAYNEESEAIKSDPRLSEFEKASLVNELRTTYFDSTEQLRVQALERIAASELD